jgi:hypothetical protein
MEREAVKTKDIGTYRIMIFQDESPDSPRNWDNLGTMVCFHRSYNLGDKHDYNHNDYSGWEEMRNAIEKNEDALIILPLYLYDHSGITISTSPFSCRWDSGQIGFIYVSKKKVREEYSVKRITKKVTERVMKLLEGEVETYDQYLTGDVYGYEVYNVEKCDHGHEHEKELDSCWGFYGEEECMKEAEGIVEWNINEEKKESNEIQ